MKTNEFLKKFFASETVGYLGGDAVTVQHLRPYAICEDGFRISIQASQCHYCTPREDGQIDYEEVELGYPSEREEMILDFAEDPDDPTNTVYGYVPVGVVDEMLQKHGGITAYRSQHSEKVVKITDGKTSGRFPWG